MQSITPKFHNLKDMITTGTITQNVIALQETWLKQDQSNDDIEIPGFHVFRADRRHTTLNRGGGTLLYIKNTYEKFPKEIVKISNDDLDLIAVILGKKIVIASVYINQAYNMDAAVETLCDKLIEPYGQEHKLLICGDFNRAPVDKFFGMHGLNNIVTFPTRKGAYLDQIWTNINPSVLTVKQFANFADHSFIECKAKYGKYSKPRQWKIRCVSELDRDRLRCELETTQWELFESITNLDERTEVVTAYINFCEETCTSKYIYLEDELSQEITTPQIKHARRRRELAFKNGKTDDFKYWSDIVESEIAILTGKILMNLRKSSKNAKDYWKSLKSTSGFESTRQLPELQNDVSVNDLNKFFLRFELNNNAVQMPECEFEEENVTRLLDNDDVKRLLKRSKKNNCRGPDGLSSMVLRNFSTELLLPIKSILNECIKHGKIPSSWKDVKITPIVKGKHKVITDPKQMRPIGQTPSMLKVLEYFMAEEINHITANRLDKYQFAYKNNVSTSDAICLVTDLANRCIDDNHTIARILFLDYSSAFNTVNRQEILDILANKFDAQKWLITLMLSYLDERTQYVWYKNQKSDSVVCKTGVIQGAVLSPILFTLITDSLRSKFNNTSIIKFADDTAIVSIIKNEYDLKCYHKTIEHVELFSNHHNLILNATKTHELIIKNKKFSNPILEANIIIKDNIIIPADSYKYLGINIDNKLSFDTQIGSMLKNVRKRVGYARTLVKRCRQPIIVRDFILACIVPVITYALHTYVTLLNQKQKKQIRKHTRFMAKLCKIPKDEFNNMISSRINAAANILFSNTKDHSNPLNDILGELVIRTGRRGGEYRVLPYVYKSSTQRGFMYHAARCEREREDFFNL